MIKLVDFTGEHVAAATALGMENYWEEREAVPCLPAHPGFPDLAPYGENGLGIAALRSGELAGYLCYENPRKNHFGTARGTVSMVHANGAVREGRDLLYSRMYQAAAEKLVARGVFSHAVLLYYHDEAAIRSFFQNGFGQRTLDGIRETLPLQGVPADRPWELREVPAEECGVLTGLYNALIRHMGASPSFMPLEEYTPGQLQAWLEKGPDRHYFAAFSGGSPIAYLRLQTGAESFCSYDPSVRSITEAYVQPEHRGTGVYPALLDFVTAWLRKRGIPLCGVDCESLNPAALRFWGKHFAFYATGLVRRIDEWMGNG